MQKRLIYSLNCPFTKETHYIGKSTDGMTRPLRHLKKSHSEKINTWVNELKLLGYKPEVKVIRYVSEIEDIDDIERFYISKYLKKGSLLLNKQSTSPLTITPSFEKSDETGLRSIGEFVKKRRKSTKLTQKQFANYCGVGLRFIRELEQGKKDNFQTKQINIVLSMFGCKIGIEKI